MLAAVCAASPTAATAAVAEDATQTASESARPTWRFREDDRSVKVVVLAGSVGAFQKMPYARHLEQKCSNVEVENLSKTGQGAWALKKRFADQALDNPRVDPHAEGQEHWLVLGGVVNSIGMPASTSHHFRRLFLMAHRAGYKVVALTPTPWGDEGDRRWRGLDGLQRRKKTEHVIDFLFGRSTPRQALGSHAPKRGDADAPWIADELPDIAIDLYDSPLRDKGAEPRDIAAMRDALARDRQWQRDHADLDAATRALELEADAQKAAELPQWYMREELRAFDHIHPNEHGHRLMAAVMCPELPASWGCTCESVEAAEQAIARAGQSAKSK
jgi:hypothetical protein